MAKTPKKPATKPASKALAVAAPAAPAVPKTLQVRLTHSEHWPAALAYRTRAASLVIGDKQSHEGALKEVTEGGALSRKIKADWKPIKQSIDKVKDAVLDLERAELEAVEAGRGPLEKRCVEWKRADDARREAAERAIREANEAAARLERQREIDAANQAAADAEADSPNLSAGELWFVTKVIEQGIDLDDTSTLNLTAMSVITKQAGYADPRAYAERLAKREKIRTAVALAIEAKANREQAAALAQEPIYTPAPDVESNLAKHAGAWYTKNYTLDRVSDLDAFVAAYRRGDLPIEAMVPNEVHLRRMAKDLKEKFEQAYPGCKLKIEEGVAG